MDRFARMVSIGVGLVFILSAYLKAVSPGETLQALRYAVHAAEHPMPAQSGLIVLLVVEMSVGALLVTGAYPRATLAAAAIILAVFVAWITWLIGTGARVPCGCGITLPFLTGEQARWASLGKSMLLMMLCAAALWTQLRGSETPRPLSWR